MKQVTVTRICQIILGNGTLDICSIPMVPGCLKHIGEQSGTKNAKVLILPTSTDNNVSISWFNSIHIRQTPMAAILIPATHHRLALIRTAIVHIIVINKPRFTRSHLDTTRGIQFFYFPKLCGPGVRRQAAGRRLQSWSWCWRLDCLWTVTDKQPTLITRNGLFKFHIIDIIVLDHFWCQKVHGKLSKKVFSNLRETFSINLISESYSPVA